MKEIFEEYAGMFVEILVMSMFTNMLIKLTQQFLTISV